MRFIYSFDVMSLFRLCSFFFRRHAVVVSVNMIEKKGCAHLKFNGTI